MANPIISGLTQEQTDTYYAWEVLVRSWAGQQARLNARAAEINVMYLGQIQAILTSITPNTNITVPNQSNLAGSQSLNVGAEAVTIQSHIQSILTSFNDSGHLQMWTKAAGAPNIIGG